MAKTKIRNQSKSLLGELMHKEHPNRKINRSAVQLASTLGMSKDIIHPDTAMAITNANILVKAEALEKSMFEANEARVTCEARAQAIASRLSRFKGVDVPNGTSLNKTLTLLRSTIINRIVTSLTVTGREVMSIVFPSIAYRGYSRQEISIFDTFCIVAMHLVNTDEVMFVSIPMCPVPLTTTDINSLSITAKTLYSKMLPIVICVRMGISDFTAKFGDTNEHFKNTLLQTTDSSGVSQPGIAIVDRTYINSAERVGAYKHLAYMDFQSYTTALVQDMDMHKALMVVADTIHSFEHDIAMAAKKLKSANVYKMYNDISFKKLDFSGVDITGNAVVFADKISGASANAIKGTCNYCGVELVELITCKKCGCTLCYGHAYQSLEEDGHVAYTCQNCFGN